MTFGDILQNMTAVMSLFGFLLVFFWNFFGFFVIRIDTVNFCVFEYCRTCVSLVFIPVSLDFEKLHQFSSILLASGSRLNVYESPLRFTCTCGDFYFNRVNFVSPLHESNKFLFESTFQ